MSSISSAGGVFSKSFDSGEQTISDAGLLTLAHGFGKMPKAIRVFAKCKIALGGYSIGDETPVHIHKEGSNPEGVSIVSDNTNINLRFGGDGSPFKELNHDDGDGREFFGDPAFTVIIRAYA